MIAEHVNHFSLAQAMCTVKTKVLLLLSVAAVASVTKTAGDGFNFTECITVDSVEGEDTPPCLQQNSSFTRNHSTTPCQTIAYVLNNTDLLDNTEVVLHGEQEVGHTINISHVEGLTIRGGGDEKPLIKCRIPSNSDDEGSGFLFENVTNLSISRLVFQGCGTLQVSTTLRNGQNVKYRSAVYIINSTNVKITETGFNYSPGKGLSIFDVDGHVEIAESSFYENKVPTSELRTYFGGGGIAIEFTHCTPGVSECNQFDNDRNKNSTYVVRDCVFSNNRATNDEVAAQVHVVQFRILTGSDGNNAGQGGGIHITVKGTATDNAIDILNCSFHNNSAQYGGGIDAVIQDYSRGNNISISGCTFTNNSATYRSGGGMNLGYTSSRSPKHNTIRVENTRFIGNSAGRGGAVTFFSSRVRTEATNRLEFSGCEFTENSASIGAAVSLRPTAGSSLFEGEPPAPLLQRCSFVRNRVVDSALFLVSEHDEETQHDLVTGALHVESIQVHLKDLVSFRENLGSAIVAASSQINVLDNTEVEFIDNTAEFGGALALLGFSILQLYTGSRVAFDSNTATVGGAIYATSPHQTEFIVSHKCFISHRVFSHPDKWNASLVFTNNKASNYGHDIYTDSLLPCAKAVFGIVTNVTTALQWSPFTYTEGVKEYTIATSPATVNFSLPKQLAPGEPVDLVSEALDDLRQRIPTAYEVLYDGSVVTYPFIADGNYLQVFGVPGTQFTLTLRTQSTRHVSLSRSGRLEGCPLGLTLKQVSNTYTCVCSASVSDRILLGVLECDMGQFRALLWQGFWIGCIGDENKVVTGYCPLGYCQVEDRQFLVPKTCEDASEQFPCESHRRGRLCGECEEGYTAHFHSDTFVCKRCEYGALGLLMYVAAELVPLVLLFAAIVIMKIKMTSGPMQSLILFAQMTTLQCSPSSNDVQHIFIRTHYTILGVLSLDFLKIDALSFCLWEGATVLDNLLFRYLTTLFTFLLIFAYIMMVRHNSAIERLACCSTGKKVVGKFKLFKNAIVHGISTFLILTYTQFTVTSFQILSRLRLYGEGPETVLSVVRLQGNVDYFGADHLPSALPAVLVLLLLSLPPPLLLISYPLLWKIKARIRPTESDTTPWAIRKLLPLIDSFQGVFRDDRRMFAGLLFLWRVILIAIAALTTYIVHYFFMMEVALVVLFVIHAIARPYKRRLYNMIDSTLFATMAIINAISWYTLYDKTTRARVAFGFQIVLMYLPLVCFAGVGVLLLLQKCGVLSERVSFPSGEENEPSMTDNATSSIAIRKRGRKRQEEEVRDADDDLFSRAAEQNRPPLVLTESEGGFELQSLENTLTTDVKV